MLPHPLSAPAKVYVDVTARCNLRCRYCYHFDSPAAVPDELSAGEWLLFIREMASCGVMNVNISGGEPLIRPDILKILDGFRNLGMRFDLVSNGSLLTAGHADFIASLSRCNFVQLSFDGPEEVHDAARGKGAFAGAVRAIRLLRSRNVPVRLRDTVGRHNLGQLMATAKIVFDELKLPALTTNCVSIENLCGKDPAGLELSIDDLFAAIEEHFTVAERYPNRLFGGTGPLGIFLRWRKL